MRRKRRIYPKPRLLWISPQCKVGTFWPVKKKVEVGRESTGTGKRVRAAVKERSHAAQAAHLSQASAPLDLSSVQSRHILASVEEGRGWSREHMYWQEGQGCSQREITCGASGASIPSLGSSGSLLSAKSAHFGQCRRRSRLVERAQALARWSELQSKRDHMRRKRRIYPKPRLLWISPQCKVGTFWPVKKKVEVGRESTGTGKRVRAAVKERSHAAQAAHLSQASAPLDLSSVQSRHILASAEEGRGWSREHRHWQEGQGCSQREITCGASGASIPSLGSSGSLLSAKSAHFGQCRRRSRLVERAQALARGSELQSKRDLMRRKRRIYPKPRLLWISPQCKVGTFWPV